MQETQVRYLVREDPLEKEMATHSSILAWTIPWMEKPGRLQSMGSQRVGHDWATSLHFTYINKLGNFNKMDTFLEKQITETNSRKWLCNFPNLFHEVNILLKAKLGKVITRKIQNNMPYEYGHCQRERKQFPLLFQVLLAHLRIEFTRERLKGESQKFNNMCP